ncbi:MAG TPA: DUF3500 domain-containing protein [Planctomycetota bacterium]|nr:DUF3500 domain-containing protein [Planctomycetota bacterium]
MNPPRKNCPDCDEQFSSSFDRRRFLTASLSAGVALAAGSLTTLARADDAPAKTPETAVKALYSLLTDAQKKDLCFDWEYTETNRGLLRTRVSNNWHITKPTINSDYFTKDQRLLIRDIFEGIIQKDWQSKIDKQLKDDAGGYGNEQNIAIFGKPDGGKFEFVMTGRHMTLRCDGHSTEHVAFGGPIFYGHAASGFEEKVGHPGNVFWEQALQANKVYEMLDGKQRLKAEVAKRPEEAKVAFHDFPFPGIPITELSSDQKDVVQKTLQKLLEPYRQSNRDDCMECLKKQGGLDKCALAFYTDDDLGNDRVWDNWRLEGPAFVWYFRGTPHVHVWVNVADDPTVKLNAAG